MESGFLTLSLVLFVLSDVGGSFVKRAERGFGSTHFALSVKTDAATVKKLAAETGWQCYDCNRGPFHVIEVWVENHIMVEVLPPEYAAEYLAFTDRNKVVRCKPL